MRERGRGQPDPPVAAAGGGTEALALGEDMSAGGGTEALALGEDMSMMAATNSGSENRASGGGEAWRGCRRPSGRC